MLQHSMAYIGKVFTNHKKRGFEPNPREQNRIYSCTIIEDESKPDKNAVFPRLNVLNKSIRVHTCCCID
jgi:hypothetical protein